MVTIAGVLAAVAVAAAPSLAHDRGPMADTVHRKSFAAEQRQGRMPKHDDVRAAIAAGDYATFKELVSDEGPLSDITEAQFPKLQEMHQHLDAAKTIADDLGLNGPMHGRMHMGNKAKREGVDRL